MSQCLIDYLRHSDCVFWPIETVYFGQNSCPSSAVVIASSAKQLTRTIWSQSFLDQRFAVESETYILDFTYPTFTMPQSLADYDSQYLSSNQRNGISFLPKPKQNRMQQHQQQFLDQSPNNTQVSRYSPDLFHGSRGHRHQESSSSYATSTASSRSSTATSMSSHPASGHISVREATLKAQEIRPTSDVAEWAHQMHIAQGRSYWWCQGCFPKELAEPLHIPKAVEKVVTGRRVRINEPSHCYDIWCQLWASKQSELNPLSLRLCVYFYLSLYRRVLWLHYVMVGCFQQGVGRCIILEFYKEWYKSGFTGDSWLGDPLTITQKLSYSDCQSLSF